ncbi:hypothetical protein ACR9WD_06005 [Glutamicibacter sp. PAEs-4]|uniref:hypothetical protein n=1 Tax=Glutamicibacter sp. PAEs-4 TaxID=3444114 RepID=UPI003EBD58B2
MADPSPESEVTIEQRLETLEGKIGPLRNQVQVQDLVISQYKQALAAANHQTAILTAQLKLATQPTE